MNYKYNKNQTEENKENNRASQALFDENRMRMIYEQSNKGTAFQFRGSNSGVFNSNADQSNFFFQVRASVTEEKEDKDDKENTKIPIESQREELDLSECTSLSNNRYTYQGKIELGLRSGFGICKSYNGEIYIGIFRRDKRHGIGKLTTKHGSSYEGEFRNGRPEGYIVYTTSTGIIHKGIMKNYVFLSQSNLEIINRDQHIEITLDKDFETSPNYGEPNQKISGIGVLSMNGKKVYEGEINDYQMSGYGILMKDGNVFQGFRMEKTFNGYCEIFYKDGTKFCGFLKNNKKHGLGCFMSRDNVVNICNYNDNFRHGASITRKIPLSWKQKETAQNEIYIFEDYHYGFRGKKIDSKNDIELYVANVYPEYLQYVNIDYSALTMYLMQMNSFFPRRRSIFG